LHFQTRWNHHTDHAGFYLGVTLWGWDSHIEIYDTRHFEDDSESKS
jgi:hypothetical protein